MVCKLDAFFILSLQVHRVSRPVEDLFDADLVAKVFKRVDFVPGSPFVDGCPDALFQLFVVGDDLFGDDEIVHGMRHWGLRINLFSEHVQFQQHHEGVNQTQAKKQGKEQGKPGRARRFGVVL